MITRGWTSRSTSRVVQSPPRIVNRLRRPPAQCIGH